MNTRRLVIPTALLAVTVFAIAAYFLTRNAEPEIAVVDAPDTVLVRNHSPILGPVDAPVTIVEFFDPSCETCRAFYPYVKQILAAYPQDVRLVIRYTPFHPASEEAIRILEAAREQDLFVPVMEALLERQGEWGADGAPNPDQAWIIAGEVGLRLDEARAYAAGPEATAVFVQDRADVTEVGVASTPTFLVNGQPLASFGPQQLADAVAAAVVAAR